MCDILNIGSRIAESRKASNMTQRMLADRLFVTAQAVSKWERGESYPDIGLLDDIAESLSVPLCFLLCASPEKLCKADSEK